MIMIVFSVLILCFGAYQIYVQIKNNKELKYKILSTNVIATREQAEKNKIINDASDAFIGKVKKIRVNLFGEDNEYLIRTLGIAVGVCGVACYVNSEYLGFDNTLILPVAAIMTFYIMYIRQVKKARTEFERDFSEALNIINSSVRVGRPVMQGFEECAKSINTDFGREFRRILMRLDIGEEPERVFMDSYHRYPYSEYFSFVITILINMKGGGQVSEVMSRLTVLITASKTLERKKVAMTAEARMSVKVLAIIPVLFFFFLKFIAPDSFDILIGTDGGRFILYYAIGSVLFGLLVVWSMMNKVG